MNGFFASIIIKVLTDPEVQAWIKKEAGDLLHDVMRDEILPAIPVAIGGAVKAGVDELIEHIPGINGVVNIATATEGAVNSVESILGSIPVLGDILKNLGVGN